MNSTGLLRIEKRPLPCWLIFWIISLPLLWGVIFQFLSLPSTVKYTADVAWIILFSFIVFRKTIKVEKKMFPLVLLITVFFVYSLVMYLFNYQSVIYFLWGARNNFRFYIFFFAIAMYLNERDADRFFGILDFLFWVNFPVILIQYFVFGYEQDYLGGIFGVEAGVNATTIIFFTIVLGNSLLKYMEKKENLYLCTGKCAVSLFVTALAELKFFFVFFIIILVMSAVLTSFSWRKLLIFAVGAAVVSVASAFLVELFGFENFLSLEAIWESATQKQYSAGQTVNRLSAISKLTTIVSPDFKERLLGMGLGNCDTSAFPICNTPFYRAYGHLRYTFFSIAFLFLEVGYVGIVMYTAFFALCYYLIRRRVKYGLCNRQHGRVALIMAVLSLILIVYNASLRAETGYMVYFVLALPFIEKDSNESDELKANI